MDDKTWHKEFLDHGDLPPGIPGPDEAWQDMRSRLDEHMPEAAASVRKSTNRSWLGLLWMSILSVIFFLAWIGFRNLNSKENKSAGIKPDITNDTLSHSNSANSQILSVKKAYTLKKAIQEENQKDKEQLIASAQVAIGSETPVGSKMDENPSVQADSQQNGNKPVVDHARVSDLSKANPSKENMPEVLIRQEDHMLLMAGLQWTVQIPTGSVAHYFAGANTRSQPFLVLLPGAWINLESEKSLFNIEFNPFFSNLVPSKPFLQSANTTTTSDTAVSISQSSSVNKLFGISAALGYAYSIGGHWWAGGGVQANWWNRAIATNRTDEEKNPVSDPSEKINSSSRYMYSLSDSAWNLFSKFQLNPFAEIQYRKGIWQSGLRMGIPISPLSKNEGPTYSLRAEFFFRLMLLRKQVRSN